MAMLVHPDMPADAHGYQAVILAAAMTAYLRVGWDKRPVGFDLGVDQSRDQVGCLKLEHIPRRRRDRTFHTVGATTPEGFLVRRRTVTKRRVWLAADLTGAQLNRPGGRAICAITP